MAAANNSSGSSPGWRYAAAARRPDSHVDRSPSQYSEPSRTTNRIPRGGDAPAELLPEHMGSGRHVDAPPQQQPRPPQLRQKSWHHPYHPAPRVTSGTLPGEPDPYHPAQHLHIHQASVLHHPHPPPHYQQGELDEERTTPYQVERTSPRRLSRAPSSSGAALRAYEQAAELSGVHGGRLDPALLAEHDAQPFQPSSFPQPSAFEPARTPFSGPKRNRGRASTLSLPQPELARQRAVPGYHASPTYPGGGAAAHNFGRDGLAAPMPGAWEEHRSRRDSTMSSMTEASSVNVATPPLAGYQQQSPLLFAPLSPRLGRSGSPAPRFASSYFAAAAAGGPPTGSRSSRPGTPVSPLNMDELSMEDRAAPSGLTISGPYYRIPPAYPRVGHEPPSGLGVHDRPHSPGALGAAHRPPRTQTMGWRHEGDDRISPTTLLSGGGDSYFAAEPHAPRHQLAPHRLAPAAAASNQQAMPMHIPPSHLNPAERVGYERRLQAQAQVQMQSLVRGEMAAAADPAQRSLALAAAAAAAAPMVAQPPMDRIAHSRRRRRPPYSYSSLIAQAISSSPEGRMTLREIYTWISNNYPGMYPMTGPESQGWQNTVRHNLSLNKSFVKVARTAQDIYDSCSSGVPSQSQAARGKGGWWTLDHSVAASQLGIGFRTPGEGTPDEGRGSGSFDAAATDASAGNRRLSRQRSYSDSVNRSASSTPHGAANATASTAPTSRDEYARYSHEARPPFAGYPVGIHPQESATGRRRSSGNSNPRPARPDDGNRFYDAPAPRAPSMNDGAIPSVLQPRPQAIVAHDEEPDRISRHPQPQQRPRGFTTSAAEPSPLRLYSVSAHRQEASWASPPPQQQQQPGSSRGHASPAARSGADFGVRTPSPNAVRHADAGGAHRSVHGHAADLNRAPAFASPLTQQTSGSLTARQHIVDDASSGPCIAERNSDEDVEMRSRDDVRAQELEHGHGHGHGHEHRQAAARDAADQPGSRGMAISDLLNG
ncbi:uncharacterized protein PSFLO_05986 [Pseudozyma flocculosa]|nr:uncharacterized protein PSFLO_05986 [Pseudozyma flocculosa]